MKYTNRTVAHETVKVLRLFNKNKQELDNLTTQQKEDDRIGLV